MYVRVENTYSGDRLYSSPQVLDIATGKSEPITTHTDYAIQPVPSPDGSHVAYVFPRDGADRNYQDVYVVDSLKGDGGNLTHSIDRNFPSARSLDARQQIRSHRRQRRRNREPLDSAPHSALQPSLTFGNVTPNTGFWLDATVGDQGQIAFVGTEPHRPSEVYLLDTPQSKPRRLTSFLRRIRVAGPRQVAEVVTWQSSDKAPKNWTENGILTYPPDYAPGKKLPLVLYIHGGPTSSSKDSFSPFAQIIAAQGWLVFEPNYRGSDNFGNDFARAIVDDSGDGPGRDVFAGLDMLKKRGIVENQTLPSPAGATAAA